MKLLFCLTLVFLLIGCMKQKVELGLNFYQIEKVVSSEEAVYMRELGEIFSAYDLILFQVYSIRGNTNYYLKERHKRDYTKDELIKISENLKKMNWRLVEKNAYGEFYCDIEGNSLGITFPATNVDLDEKNLGYFVYQSYGKISVTFSYASNHYSEECKRNSYNINS